ncbi:MAG: serine hydrolase [Nitrospirae bacterium]|nr:serine hydrolase [Nitrospirota bacterium]
MRLVLKRWIRSPVFIIAFALFTFVRAYSSRHVLWTWVYVPVKMIYTHVQSPDVIWEKAAPAEEGFDENRLEILGRNLESRHTDAFLVVRGGRIIYEWYALQTGANDEHYESAMAKAVVAVPTVLVGLTDNRFSLDDPLSKYAPELKNDPLRSQIRIRDLLFHQSGLDDVDFNQAKQGKVDGWKKAYYEHREKRFEYALFQVPMLFQPGTRGQYSGIGYYALAYAVTKALQGAPESDIKTLFSKRIMEPLGIPKTDWSLSYGESYEFAGLKLYAFGSGADLSARAVARIGELVLERGQWHGQRIFDARWLDDVLGRVEIGDPKHVSNHHGFILNRNGRYASLPLDAFFGEGGSHNVVLVVPSLDLVVVRNGESLADPGEGYEDALEIHLFRPIIESIVGAGSRPARWGASEEG